MKNKILVVILLISILAVVFAANISGKKSQDRSVDETLNPGLPQILANGSIVSQTSESLHFQTGGKLVYLPLKEGDSVAMGQVIAALDSTEAQKNVTASEASYRSSQAALNLVLDNIHLFQYGNGGFDNVGSSNETQTQKTQRQQAEEAVNVAFDNLQKAKNQLSNTSIVAPFPGTIVSEDVKDIGVNITPATAFVLADLSKLIFQAQVSGNDIISINTGDKTQIKLDGFRDKQFSGTVSKIYPEKIKLASGGDGYKVDINLSGFDAGTKFGMTGSVVFEDKLTTNAKVLPSWVILGHQYVWVMGQNSPILRNVTVGETVGDKTQILDGLSKEDKVILDPETVVKGNYQII